MAESEVPRPPRRPRYSGKNPRRFEDRYKEQHPERYAGDVAKVLASGKTPAGSHRPIMVQEILDALKPQPGETAVDCTLGYGGHTRALLEALAPDGRVIGFDVDPIELPRTVDRLRNAGYGEDRLIPVRSNFAGLAHHLPAIAPEGADLVLADLGVSSMQLDNPARGFTFKEDGPLDMRMNPEKGRPASEFLSTQDLDSLTALLKEAADEPHARRLADLILKKHQSTPLKTTTALADTIRTAEFMQRLEREDVELTVRRVFQAIRIAVNEEFVVLDAFLNQLPWCLKPRGRVAILTFHSGEDRRVKAHFKQGLHAGWYAAISENVIRAGGQERRENPRSVSAKLRWAIRSE